MPIRIITPSQSSHPPIKWRAVAIGEVRARLSEIPDIGTRSPMAKQPKLRPKNKRCRRFVSSVQTPDIVAANSKTISGGTNFTNWP